MSRDDGHELAGDLAELVEDEGRHPLDLRVLGDLVELVLFGMPYLVVMKTVDGHLEICHYWE